MAPAEGPPSLLLSTRSRKCRKVAWRFRIGWHTYEVVFASVREHRSRELKVRSLAHAIVDVWRCGMVELPDFRKSDPFVAVQERPYAVAVLRAEVRLPSYTQEGSFELLLVADLIAECNRENYKFLKGKGCDVRTCWVLEVPQTPSNEPEPPPADLYL